MGWYSRTQDLLAPEEMPFVGSLPSVAHPTALTCVWYPHSFFLTCSTGLPQSSFSLTAFISVITLEKPNPPWNNAFASCSSWVFKIFENAGQLVVLFVRVKLSLSRTLIMDQREYKRTSTKNWKPKSSAVQNSSSQNQHLQHFQN
jgi:hypothetical protein